MATAYFYYGGSSLDLNDSSNWWDDSGHTTPFSGSVPSGGDNAIILGSTMPTSNSGLTGLNSWDSSGADTGTSISGTVTSGIAISNIGTVTVGVSGDNTSSHTWSGSWSANPGTYTGYGSSVFNGTPANANGSTFNLHDASTFNYGGTMTHTSDTFTLYDSATIQAGTFSGSGFVTLNGSSQLLATSTCQFTTAYSFAFNDNSQLNGASISTVSNCGFANNAKLTSGTIQVPNSVNITFANNSQARGGTITLTGNANLIFSNTALLNGGTVQISGSGSVQTVNYSADHAATTDVRHGTTYNNGGSTGSAYIPGASDVRSGVNVDATTGTCAVPGASNVRSGTSVDATTGSLVVPPVSAGHMSGGME